jgi:hypothetical protein
MGIPYKIGAHTVGFDQRNSKIFPKSVFINPTIIRAAIKKNVDVWLGIIFDSPGD